MPHSPIPIPRQNPALRMLTAITFALVLSSSVGFTPHQAWVARQPTHHQMVTDQHSVTGRNLNIVTDGDDKLYYDAFLNKDSSQAVLCKLLWRLFGEISIELGCPVRTGLPLDCRESFGTYDRTETISWGKLDTILLPHPPVPEIIVLADKNELCCPISSRTVLTRYNAASTCPIVSTYSIH